MKKVIYSSIALLVFSGSAFAETGSKGYITGGGQITTVDLSALDGLPGVSYDDQAEGINIGAGFKVNDNFAIEGGYLNVGEFSATATGAGTTTYGGKTLTINGSLSLEVDTDAFYLGPALNLPVNCIFQSKSATYSTRSLPPIPRESCHLFRLKSATYSRAKLPP